MSDVIFENDDTKPRANYAQTKKGLPGKLVKWGLANNEKQANLILLVFSLVMLLSIFLILSFKTGNINNDVVDPETIDQSAVPGT